ncbi:MAG: PAS domain-containing protein [Methylorubrum populi]
MKHPTSRQLHAYWDRLRGERAAPERGEIEPGEIRNLLADSFILETEPARRSGAVRLAGTRLCALFGRELRGSSFVDLWGEPQGRPDPSQVDPFQADPFQADPFQADPWRLVETAACDTVGIVAGLTGFTARGEPLDLELLLLPLRHRGKTQARLLGSLSPHCIPAWLGSRPILRVETISLRVLEAAAVEPTAVRSFVEALPEPANDARPVRFGHLLVHEGGRSKA